MARFEPQPGTQFKFRSTELQVMPHPMAPSMVFGQEGRKAIVYQVRSSNNSYALKIFKRTFRNSSLVDICQLLSQIQLVGLEVCKRECLTNKTSPDLLQTYPEMEYAVLMPWIEGSTWLDIVLSQQSIDEYTSRRIAKYTADILANLEAKGLAHCDLAGPNVIVNKNTGTINLIDVEDMFGPDFPVPNNDYPQGTDGYQHKEILSRAQGQWCAEGDRFAGAILLSEMLTWHNPQIRKLSAEDHFFTTSELQKSDSIKYDLMVSVLSTISPDIASCFREAWRSNTLLDCPPLKRWAELLEFPIVKSHTSITTSSNDHVRVLTKDEFEARVKKDGPYRRLQMAPIHVKAAVPVLKPIFYAGFFLSVIIVISGIGEVIWNAYSPAALDIFGMKVKAWQVGVASIILGTLFMVVHASNILAIIYKLAALPDDRPPRTSETTLVDTRGGTYVGGNVTSQGNFVGRDVTEKRDQG